MLAGQAHLAERVAELDDNQKSLISLTHKDAAKNTYLDKLGAAKKLLVSLDADVTAGTPNSERTSLFDLTDAKILETLSSVLPSASASYEQALRDLSDDSRKSYRGPATDLREALRETLDHLAPDKEVKAMEGYKQDPAVSGPTMKQKVRYILRIRERPKAQIDPLESAAEIIDEIIGTFVRSVYTRSNVSTHTATGRNEVLRLRHYVRIGFIEILEIRE